MNSSDLTRALKELPETHLSIIDLIWKVVEEAGSLEAERIAYYRKEIDQAVAQAEAYAKETKEMVRCLKRIALS